MSTLQLWQHVIPEFEAADSSQGRIVTRSARRLVERGYTVTAITQLQASSSSFSWGIASKGRETLQSWKIDFFHDEPGSKAYSGSLFVRHRCKSYEKVHHLDEPPAATMEIEFAGDRLTTSRRLGLKDADLEWEKGGGQPRRKRRLSNVERRSVPLKGQKKKRNVRGRNWQATANYYDERSS